MPTARPSTILVADDTEFMRNLIRACLKEAGLYADVFSSASELLNTLNDETLVCILDLKMPGMDGLACLREIKQRFPTVEVVMLTGVNEARDALAAVRAGAFDYQTKPFDPAELVRAVRRALQLARAAQESADLKHSVGDPGPVVDLLGDSPAMNHIKEQLARISATEETVLLTGESGTGKTRVARSLHAMSRRSTGPFITVSCPSLPRELLESEMFGHEKGAFSGAHQKRLGRVELAEGGTLFLDEVGELSFELQAKLLTFLQDHTFFRIGGQRALHADVRIVAATNQDLPRLCREGRFREDLYYRLHVLPLEMPPLRVRPADVRLLAQHFLENFAARNTVPVPKLSSDAWAALMRYPWPGNVRELENLLARTATLARSSGAIEVTDLPPNFQPGYSPSAGSAPGFAFSLAGKRLDEIELLALQHTLVACGGNRAEAARQLGITEKTIYNMMRRQSQAGADSQN
ncbi:sigma-54-dependent transcriptional regulator [Oleiharenicola lentus]|uniref:sigma-54-dependent transcriptional regulator n=1 Tax=Oleiharenicola lentus TaxID=2508720 RepID=UPI003F671B12